MAGKRELRIGLFGIGLATYWPQFPGLEDRLKGYLSRVEERLSGPARTVVNFQLVDSPERAYEIGHKARQEDVDILVLYVTTYALSSTVLPVVRRAKVPVLVLNLQPSPAIDYEYVNGLTDRTVMTGEWLAYCSICPAPEIANVFTRVGVPFHEVTGSLEGDPQCWQEVEEWMTAAQVVHSMSHLRVGLLGHYYSGMLDVATDLTSIASTFGSHLEMLEVDELSALRRTVSDGAIARRVTQFRDVFSVAEDCLESELERAARTSIALDEFVERHALDAMAYYYKGTGIAENEDTMSSIILGTSLLTARGVPVAGEFEVKNVLAMKILDLLQAGGSFTEYYAADYRDDVILLGHDGSGHPQIAEGKTVVRPLRVYHGKVGMGLSVEMSVKTGPATCLSVVDSRSNGFNLLVAEGEVVHGKILEIGNTNSRFRFPCGAREFIRLWNRQAPAHHCAVGIGHHAGELEKVARLLNIESIKIC